MSIKTVTCFTDHPILSVLESRTWDKTAQDFAKKQRERVAS